MKKNIVFLIIIASVLCGCNSNIESDTGLNIIFLDIDGVLNTQNSINMQIAEKKGIYNENVQAFLYDFDKKAMKNLKDVIDTSDGRIVLISTWRLNDVLMKELLSQFKKNDIDVKRIIGKTPDLHDEITENLRAHEIEKWLNNSEEKINRFVILDDIDNMGEYTESNLVVCNKFDGLTKKLKNNAIRILCH